MEEEIMRLRDALERIVTMLECDPTQRGVPEACLEQARAALEPKP